MATRIQEKMTEMPDLPREFGDDGGYFYKYYDELAEEYDENLVKNLKAQLDGILIFAGLFAGVNSTFLVFTLPQLSANPADDTNALLLQIALGVNSSITSTADLPSASFVAPPRIYLVNVLFSVSLMLALFSSLLAVFGQQWIVYYRKQGGGGAEGRRWEQLRRYLGAKRWRLELVLDDLVPSLLQIGLVIFCIAFALYIGTLSKPLSHIIVWLLGVAAATILAMATCTALDPWCPFKQPLSRIVRSLASAALAFVVSVAILGFILILFSLMPVCAAIWPRSRRTIAELQTFWPGGTLDLIRVLLANFNSHYRFLMSAEVRSAEDPGDLKIEVLRRVMGTSEDRNAFVYAAMNLQVLRNEHALFSLAGDHEFYARLRGLHEAAMRETQGRKSPSHYSLIESKVLSNSYFHFMITTCSDPYLVGGWDDIRLHVSPKISATPGELSHALEGSALTLNASCDQCSHCLTLTFSIRVAYIILENAKSRSIPNLHIAFEGVLGTSAQSHDLRLGSVVASVMLSSTQWDDGERDILPYRPQNKFLTALFAAYRETSGQVMFETISRALVTVSAQWSGKPDHEMYVWLFELCLSPRSKEILDSDVHTTLEHVDDHLLSLENWIREEGASETDRQRGRDYQNRYVQAVARFCADPNYSSQKTWLLISPPMERYLKFVKKLIDNHPEHPENSNTMDLLLYMESAFAGPQLVGPSASHANPEQVAASSNFRQLLDRIGLSVPAKALVSKKDNAVQLAISHDDGKRVGLPEIVYDMWGY